MSRLGAWWPGLGSRALSSALGWWGVPVPARWRLLNLAGARIDRTVVIYPGACGLGRGVTIGAWSYLGPRFQRMDEGPLTIGRKVQVGPECLVLTVTHSPGTTERRAGERVCRPVSIGDGTWIGARVTVLPGVSIGSGCVVAAGAVVTHDCAPDGLYAGVPARRVRDL